MCYISSPGGTPDRTRSARENVADEQQDCTAQEERRGVCGHVRGICLFSAPLGAVRGGGKKE